MSFFVGSDNLIQGDILVPRIYGNMVDHGAETVKLKDLEAEGLIRIKTVTCDVRQSEYDMNGTVPFIRTTDLGVMEFRSPVHKVTEDVYERNKNSQDLRPFDILIIKDGTYRIGESVMLLKDDRKVVLQGHFYHVRVLNDTKISPYYLYWALRKTHPVILDLVLVQSTLSSITIDRLRDIGIPFLSPSRQREIGQKMKRILFERRVQLNHYERLV